MAHRAIWECKACPKHCTLRTEERNERPPRCIYWRDNAVWLRKDGQNKESIKKDYPRVCASCGGGIITVYRAVRGSAPRLYVECKVCKDVREILPRMRRALIAARPLVGTYCLVLPCMSSKDTPMES